MFFFFLFWQSLRQRFFGSSSASRLSFGCILASFWSQFRISFFTSRFFKNTCFVFTKPYILRFVRLGFLYFFVRFSNSFVMLVFFFVWDVFFVLRCSFLTPNGSLWGAPGHHFGVIFETSLPRRVQWAPRTPKSTIFSPFGWSFGVVWGSFGILWEYFSVHFL